MHKTEPETLGDLCRVASRQHFAQFISLAILKHMNNVYKGNKRLLEGLESLKNYEKTHSLVFLVWLILSVYLYLPKYYLSAPKCDSSFNLKWNVSLGFYWCRPKNSNYAATRYHKTNTRLETCHNTIRWVRYGVWFGSDWAGNGRMASGEWRDDCT